MTILKPLFIFSLPRSGSTFLQRVVATHKDVATVSEPWILLPYLYTLKKDHAFADYAHYGAVNAIKDLYSTFPNGLNDYLKEMGDFVLRLYAKAAGEGEYKYFLDKTPRYHLIVDEIIEMFPNGKFIFLWRNPLAIISSIIESMGSGNWVLYRYNVDLFDGLLNLLNAAEKYHDSVYCVRYEDIIQQPKIEISSLFEYLGLTFDQDNLSLFSEIQFSGRYGDSTGINLYQAISAAPLDKWQEVLTNPWRKRWSKQYLNWIGAERLEFMGYEYNQLNSDLKGVAINFRKYPSDLSQHTYGLIFRLFELRILRQKIRAKTWREINAHL